MKWVYICVVGVLAVGFVYLLSSDEPPALMQFPQALSDEPDALIEGFELSQFDPQGKQLYRIAAARASYFERQGRTDIRDVSVWVYATGSVAWQLRADEGIFQEHMPDPLLSLRGNVQLASSADGDEPIKFETASLEIYPRRQFVESLSRVIVENDGSKIYADRFEADLATREISFSGETGSQVELVLQTDS